VEQCVAWTLFLPRTKGAATSPAPVKQRFRVEIKAWIPVDHVVDPESFLHRFIEFPSPLPAVVFYESRYRGDGHAGYAGDYRVLQAVSFDWDGTNISGFTKEPVPNFGTSHRDVEFVVMGPGSNVTSGSRSSSDIATKEVTASQRGNDVKLGIHSANPLTIAPSPDIDADVTLVFSASFHKIFLSWATDLMPSHGYRIERDGVVLDERTTNDVSGVDLFSAAGGLDIFRRLNVKGNVGSKDLPI
jgi:hypothetical protein